MSTISTPKEVVDGWRRPAAKAGRRAVAGHTSRSDVGTYLAVAVMVLPAVVLLVVGIVAGLPPRDGEIEQGVSVGGHSVSGSGWDQTSAELQTQLDGYLDQPLVLSLDENRVETTPRELGITFDMDGTFERAQDVGRGGLFESARERLEAHTVGVEVAPVVIYDGDQFLETLRTLSAGVVTRPANAELYFDGDGVAVQPSSDGVAIDTTAAVQRLQQAVGEFQSEPIEVPTITIEPEVSTADLEAVQDEADRLAGEPIYLRDRDSAWQFQPHELVGLLSYQDGSVSLELDILEARMGVLESEINQQPKNAGIVRKENGTFAIASGTIERTLDVDASVDALTSALETDERIVDLAVNEAQPDLAARDLHALHQRLNNIVNRGMTVVWDQGEVTLDSVAFSNALVFDERQGTVSFDRQALSELLKPVADSAARPPSGLRWKNGQFVTTENTSPGMAADLEASLDAVVDAALNGRGTASLVMKETTDPEVAAASISVNDVLGYAKSYYGDSSANRKTNIEVAVEAIDGTLIPPHSEFSFNRAIGGTATLDDGYMMGYGIITGGDGQPQTVPSVAGGICQVSTMVFQSAFWAGMPITNRSWHLYWIPKYGQGPGGLQGLDATVAPEVGLDFTFQNPTDDWIAISAYADGQHVSVELRGVDQGWFVEVDGPEISNVVEAETEKIYYQEDSSMEPGQKFWVESARNGFDASIHRTVRDENGEAIREATFESYYKASRNVVLVAPGEAPENE